MRGFAYWVARARNGIAKVRARLTPFGESVWPGVRNDLFVAHESIYEFFSQFVQAKRVLDAGCGTGYGASRLRKAGALSVVGIDIDSRSVSYATRHYSNEGVSFLVQNCETMAFSPNAFDVVVSSNAVEHLETPSRFLEAARRSLASSGVVLLALPPILGTAEFEEHSHIHYHRSNLTVDEWIELLTNDGWLVDLFGHCYAGPGTLDFASPFRTKVKANNFSFNKTDRDCIYAERPITVIYSLTRLDDKASNSEKQADLLQ